MLGLANLNLNFPELARTANLFHGGQTAVAGGISVVSDLPTTTADAALYNNNNPESNRCLLVYRAHLYVASGTPAAGATLLGCVTSQPVADAQKPTAHTTNWSIGGTSGDRGNHGAFWKAPLTIPAGAFWFGLGSNFQLAAANLGQGDGAGFETMLIVPPRHAAGFAVLSGAGTTPKYMLAVRFAVLPLDLTTII